MKKKQTIRVLLFTSLLFLNVNLTAYDIDLAKKFNETFSQYSQKHLNNSKMLVSSDEVMKMLQNKDKFILLDIRTPAEMDIIGLRTKNTLEIPFNQLFKKEELNKLPTDKPIIVVCHSGSRALQAATNLIILGFKNTQVLYGGIIALAKSNSTRNAPIK